MRASRRTGPFPARSGSTVATHARRAAYDILRSVLRGDDLPAVLTQYRDVLPDPRDRALVTDLTTGTLRWQAALDHLLALVIDRPLARLDREVHTVLRLGAYQLVFLDRVPPSAAVHESVTLVRRAGKSSAAGFVNAVLRKVAVIEPSVVLPAVPSVSSDREAQLAYLSITCSHPRWLVERWLERDGFTATLDWVRFNNLAPPLTLRVNRLRTTLATLAERLAEHGVRTTPTRFALEGLTVVEGNPYRTPAAQKGLFLAQDEASQLVTELVDAHPGHWVLDTCAAPGVKTTALSAAIGTSGQLVAGDLRPARLRLLRSTLDSLGGAASIVQLDLKRGVPCQPVFDRVLVDAPCSGLGTIRRDPDIRWRRKPADLTQLSKKQHAMLRQAARVVRPGGRLIYATCSSEPEENHAVVRAFLNDHAMFRALSREEQHTLPVGLLRVLDHDGWLVTKPARHGLEAFFAVALERDPQTRSS